jgi:hypothetical protein
MFAPDYREQIQNLFSIPEGFVDLEFSYGCEYYSKLY